MHNTMYLSGLESVWESVSVFVSVGGNKPLEIRIYLHLAKANASKSDVHSHRAKTERKWKSLSLGMCKSISFLSASVNIP